ncbi:hypothetical protein [Botrimarina hoheduenensis]|uniref:Uncharacterized protein n=1 Tax=Botrimarina hoheduenensis TaxID=2528000 RepID=A0A5C5VS99_9BACT|nr:hypothetical protein [Botrimarina hoheduenensis]TWT41516.1 hypothetical protein Pla111_28920 [Botrimarina hoheduenensis]
MSRRTPKPRYEAAVYQDDPDAIATVSVFDPDRNSTIPVEIGFYYHEKTVGKIYLLGDVRSRQLLSEADAIDLVRFTKSRPSDAAPKQDVKPAASYRPVAGPTRQ